MEGCLLLRKSVDPPKKKALQELLGYGHLMEKTIRAMDGSYDVLDPRWSHGIDKRRKKFTSKKSVITAPSCGTSHFESAIYDAANKHWNTLPEQKASVSVTTHAQSSIYYMSTCSCCLQNMQMLFCSGFLGFNDRHTTIEPVTFSFFVFGKLL